MSAPPPDAWTLVNVLMLAASAGGLGAGPLHALRVADALSLGDPGAAGRADASQSARDAWAATAAAVGGWDTRTLLSCLSGAAAQLDALVAAIDADAPARAAELDAARVAAAFCAEFLGTPPSAHAGYADAVERAARTAERRRRAAAAATDARALLTLYAHPLGAVAAAAALDTRSPHAAVPGETYVFMAPILHAGDGKGAGAGSGARRLPPASPRSTGATAAALSAIASATTDDELYRGVLAAVVSRTRCTSLLRHAAALVYAAVDACSPAALDAAVGLADVLAFRVRPTPIHASVAAPRPPAAPDSPSLAPLHHRVV
jgi:hypothetical protein